MSYWLDEFHIFLLILLRVSALLIVAPIFGHRLFLARAKVGLAVMVSMATVAAQGVMVARFVTPYARLHAYAAALPMDILLLDPRGGVFAQDIVRVPPNMVHRPIFMDLSKLDKQRVDTLCRKYRIGIIDRTDYRAAGILADDSRPDARHIARIRAYLDLTGCARQAVPSGTGSQAAL